MPKACFATTFKLKDKRREGAQVIKRYHPPATPYARALAHPKVSKAVKARLRELYRTLDPVALLAEVRAAQAELGTRVDGRAGKIAAPASPPPPAPDVATFAKRLGEAVQAGEQRVIHRRMHKPDKTRVRMPSMLDPHIEDIERWLVAEPRRTALSILGRLAERCPGQFGPPQHTTVQRQLKVLRRKVAGQLMAGAEIVAAMTTSSIEPGERIGGSSRAQPDLAVPLAASAPGPPASRTPSRSDPSFANQATCTGRTDPPPA